MRPLIIAGLAVLAIVLVGAFWCIHRASAAPAATDQPVIAQKTCPVMGNPINPKVYVDYKGRRIYFCCNMCPPVFNKDPEKYIKIVDEQLKAAKEKPEPVKPE
jgi:YHS domain-containing protein